ncbi:MAG TPA: SRPBCC family protein [Prolixibacteraceae bacterium]|nr:SRPBCC family protein [Prolixibacteraceae bacterium]
MKTTEEAMITVQTEINAPIDIVWKIWTTSEDIVKWYYASDNWHTPSAENDLQEGGIFNFRMEAKDGSLGFNFEGVYQKVIVNQFIEYVIDDCRVVSIAFTSNDDGTKVVETFEAESIHLIAQQRDGWQAILDNFKKYTESNK